MVTASRGGVLKSKKFSHREVDLSNLGGRDKKNTIATELQEAISALKRPNRLLAGQTIMETSERRTSSILTSSKKSKKPVRNPLFNSVQITATPNATRHKDMIGNVQSLPAYNRNNNPGPYLNPSPDIIPASSAIRIPQSAIRPACSNSRDFQETPLANSTPTRMSSKIKGTPTVDETPSRQPGNRAQDFGRMMLSSPLMPRNSNIMQFLSVPTSTTGNSRDIALSVSNTAKLSDMVFSTPVKTLKTFGRQEIEAICPDTGRGIERVVQDDQFARGMQGSGSEAPKLVMNDDGDDSFYKSLGWDNDMDDLL
jgi:DNA replication regulator SLD3